MGDVRGLLALIEVSVDSLKYSVSCPGVANRILETLGHLYEVFLYLFVIDPILRVFITATIERVGIFYFLFWRYLV